MTAYIQDEEPTKSLWELHWEFITDAQHFLLENSGYINKYLTTVEQDFRNDSTTLHFFGANNTSVISRSAGVLTGPVAMAVCGLITAYWAVVLFFKALYDLIKLDFKEVLIDSVFAVGCILLVPFCVLTAALNPLVNLVELAAGGLNSLLGSKTNSIPV